LLFIKDKIFAPLKAFFQSRHLLDVALIKDSVNIYITKTVPWIPLDSRTILRVKLIEQVDETECPNHGLEKQLRKKLPKLLGRLPDSK
jgi:hypothetical protein